MEDILYKNSVSDIRIREMVSITVNLNKHDYSKDYLTFKALEDGEFVYTICYGDDSEGGGTVYASAELQYSFNGEDWFDWARPNETSESINVLANQKLYVRGYTQPLDSAITDHVYGTVNFSSTCRFNACGLLSSLLYGYDYTNKEFIWTKQPMKTTHFYGLFDNCDKLISAENLILPQELVRECYSNMFGGCTSLTTAPNILPATTLALYCYSEMFSGCTSLTTSPELPATTLANQCYLAMFQGCTSLTTAPTLPATTLATQCYDSMFYDCTSLTEAPELSATTLADHCYSSMFSGCKSLTTAPVLPATTLVSGCYSSMFYGCTALTTAPELPATTLADSCYYEMFYGCTSLTTAPELPAITLKASCYNYMFQNCSSLNYIKAMFTTTPGSSYTSNWVSGVAATGTFVKNSAAQWNVSGVNGIPTGWTVETVDS